MNRTIITVEWESQPDLIKALERVSLSNLTNDTYESQSFKYSFETVHSIEHESLMRLDKIDRFKAYAKELGVYNKKRNRPLPDIRRLVWLYLYERKLDLGFSLEAIGEITGGHDHATVLFGLKSIKSMITSKYEAEELNKKKAEIFERMNELNQ